MSQSHTRTGARILRCVSAGEYVATDHTVLKLALLDLDVSDLEDILRLGDVRRRLSNDPRGTRWVLAGVHPRTGRDLEVVARFTRTNTLLIITVYEVLEPDHD